MISAVSRIRNEVRRARLQHNGFPYAKFLQIGQVADFKWSFARPGQSYTEGWATDLLVLEIVHFCHRYTVGLT